jgi:hypothetical protein
MRVQRLREQGKAIFEQANCDKNQVQVLEKPLPEEILRVPQFRPEVRRRLQVSLVLESGVKRINGGRKFKKLL